MIVKDNYSLKEHNTFGIEATAAHFVEYDSVDELQMFVGRRAANGDTTPLLHIGSGSNLLFLGDYAGTVLHSQIRDITVTANEGDYVYVRVGAGLVWDDWVQYAVDSHWYGLENLSLIPGEVGAAAVQNIGAYGSEAKDFILFVDTVDLETGAIRHFTAEECRYGYRDSIFKQELRGRYAITHVHFRLSHSFRPCLDYGGIRRALEERGISHFKYLFSTHPHDDHIEGLRMLLSYGFTTDEFVSVFSKGFNYEYQEKAVRMIDRKNAAYRQLQFGDTLTLGGASLTVYNWEKGTTINAKSAMTRVEFGGCSALLCADIIGDTQNQFLKTLDPAILLADVMKAPHHGLTALVKEFLDAVNPSFVWVTNYSGDKVKGIGNQMKSRGIPVKYSGDGTVYLETDGTDWYVYQTLKAF